MTEQGWHLEKGVSLAHILTTLSMIAAALAFGFNLESRITANEKAIAQVTLAMQTSASDRVDILQRTARIEEQMKYQIEALRRIESKLDSKK